MTENQERHRCIDNEQGYKRVRIQVLQSRNETIIWGDGEYLVPQSPSIKGERERERWRRLSYVNPMPGILLE